MAQRKTRISDGVFWGFMGALMAATLGGSIGFVFAQFYGAGWLGGAALGAVVFLIGGVILSRTATSTNLPPPNTLRAPVAPPGGAFRAPPGGRFQAPQAAVAAVAVPAAVRPEPVPTAQTEPAAMVQAASAAMSEVIGGASAAVTSAAQAARAALADMTAPAAVPARPATLEAPRGGSPDDLKKIKGVGPKLEGVLHELGFYHFDQVAAWDAAEVAWVDSNLEGFHGRASRDDWVGQAKHLAAGGETEFSARVGKGEVY